MHEVLVGADDSTFKHSDLPLFLIALLNKNRHTFFSRRANDLARICLLTCQTICPRGCEQFAVLRSKVILYYRSVAVLPFQSGIFVLYRGE